MHRSCTVLLQWSGTVLHAGSMVSCSFCSWLRQPCQPQWAFCFFLLVGSAYGKMNLREAAGEPNLQWNCGLCTSRQSTSLGRYRRYSCWVVPKTWYAGESWRRPPLRTRGQGKPLEALAKGPKLRCGLALFSPCSSRSVVSG